VRRSLPLLVLLLASAACGQLEQGSSPPRSERSSASNEAMADTGDMAGEATRESGPGIDPTVAPDVAFDYRYGFRLAAGRIAEVQDQHQQLCERYTLARCRITGMSYRTVNEDDVEATLAFAVDPAIARQFGRDAVQRVNDAEGTVTESEISGTDVGTTIRGTGRSIAQLEAELARIETRLAAMGPNSALKSDLDRQAGELRAEIRRLREANEANQETLATTPILFRYGSGAYAPGEAEQPSLAQTAEETGEDALYGLTMLLRMLIILSPWLLAAGLIVWLVRLIRRRMFPAVPAAAGEADAAA
jgi:Domain of unknown function (DUF4349)